jgi:hypothetical protein
VEPTRYTLAIFEPGSSRSRAGFYESSTPFAAISVGDAVHPGGWPKQGQGPPRHLRATEVHHYLGESAGQVSHLVTVYTKEVVLR